MRLAERWILAVLRNRLFYSLAELRAAVAPLVERLNDRPMRQLRQARRQLFETLARAALRPLPPQPYEFALWKQPKVNIDYHVAFAADGPHRRAKSHSAAWLSC